MARARDWRRRLYGATGFFLFEGLATPPQHFPHRGARRSPWCGGQAPSCGWPRTVRHRCPRERPSRIVESARRAVTVRPSLAGAGPTHRGVWGVACDSRAPPEPAGARVECPPKTTTACRDRFERPPGCGRVASMSCGPFDDGRSSAPDDGVRYGRGFSCRRRRALGDVPTTPMQPVGTAVHCANRWTEPGDRRPRAMVPAWARRP